MDSTGVIAYIVAWFGTASIAWQLFERADKSTKDEWKKKLSEKLKNIDGSSFDFDWASEFLFIFDKILSPESISGRRFVASILSTITGVSIASILIYSVDDSFFDDIWKYFDLNIRFFIYLIIINFVADYFSIIETRALIRSYIARPWTLRKVSGKEARELVRAEIRKQVSKKLYPFYRHFPGMDYGSRKFRRQLLYDVLKRRIYGLQSFWLLIEDLVWTSFIYGFALVCFLVSLFGVQSLFPIFSSVDEKAYLYFADTGPASELREAEYVTSLGPELILISFTSTFFTSIWALLFFLGFISIRTLGKFGPVWQAAQDKYLDVETKPLHALGLVSMVLIGVVYLVGGLVSLIV